MEVHVLVARTSPLKRAHRPNTVHVAIGEACAHQHRYLNAVKVGRHRLPPFVAQRMLRTFLSDVDRQSNGSFGDELPHAAETVFDHSPRCHEIAVHIGETLPRADRLQVWRMQGGRLVLGDRKIGDPEHPDVAGRPGLGARPLDELADVVRFLVGEQSAGALGCSRAASVGIDHHVPVPGPPHRIGRLPSGLTRKAHGLALIHDPILGAERPPRSPTLRERILAVRMRRHDHREGAVTRRTIDVDAKQDTVAHCDRNIRILDQVRRCLVHGDRGSQDVAHPSARVRRRAGAAPWAIVGGRHPHSKGWL